MATTTTITNQECIDMLNELYEFPVPYKYLGVPIQFFMDKLKAIQASQQPEPVTSEPQS